MTPKQKAEELFDTFSLGGCGKHNAEKCIDEIIKESELYDYGHPILFDKRLIFWREVKHELSLL